MRKSRLYFYRRLFDVYFFSLCVNIKIDGKKNPLMINVWSKIPTAMTNPNKNNSCKGCVIKTENVAARMSPADEITPPDKAAPIPTASFHEIPWFEFSLIRETSIIL